MYWYLTGAVVSMVIAVSLKRSAQMQKKYYQAALILVLGFLLAAVVSVTDDKEEKSIQIARSEPGQGTKEKEFLVDVEGQMKNYPLTLEIAEKKLTLSQKKAYLKAAEGELDVVILGENSSKEEVSRALFLPEYLQEGIVEVSYRFSDYDIFHGDGTIRQEPQKPTLVEITAELSCQEEISLYRFSVCAVPREKSIQEQIAAKLGALVSDQHEQENVSYVTLPEQWEGKSITWRKDVLNRSFVIALLGAAAAVGLLVREKENEKQESKKREQQLIFDYPGIVGKFSLLLGAGMNITLAWEKIALAYQTKYERGETEKRYAYEEMLRVLHEIRDGSGELQAYENFGNRCQIAVYRRLSSIIIQNVRKGSLGMTKLLEQEEWEAFEQRKAHARQMGEEAGTKLLLPMGIMLVIVLAILVIPAGMSLNL